MATKVKLKLAGKVLPQQLHIPVIRTAIIVTPDAPRRRRFQPSRQRKRRYNAPPRRSTYKQLFGAPRRHIAVRPYQPFIGPGLQHKNYRNQKDAATEMLEHSKMFPKAGKLTKSDKDADKVVEALARLKKFIYPGLTHMWPQIACIRQNLTRKQEVEDPRHLSKEGQTGIPK